ncbi:MULTISPECIES: hypothetical protein [Agrobacterium]|uniref:hypothetical protein n=1 Tax=Agrobacterium TaxID=357 RepID=UPI0004A038C7|nr:MULTISPECIES: hypothetical protein [Agrobacterium]KDR86374.1 hypothetical protein K538_26475 [Agrobacterium tumefaciens GW4]KVK53085.1 hypothetical protein L904_01970 [Agrobacterium sp. LY4]NUL19529.1 hypothetical protein [Agrobacterium tumefaciens]
MTVALQNKKRGQTAPHTGIATGVSWYSITTKDCQIACLQLQSRGDVGLADNISNATAAEPEHRAIAAKKPIMALNVFSENVILNEYKILSH